MKQTIKNILNIMKNTLTNEQLNELESVLTQELLSRQKKDKLSNEQLLNDFITSKSYENCSKQTIGQYRRENAIVTSLTP